MEWSTFWSALSALATLAALVVAFWAMLRWRKQDELKAKMAFKTSVSDYLNALLMLPEFIVDGHVRSSYKLEIKSLIESLAACHRAWLITEGLLQSNANVNDCWNKIFENHKHYISGNISSSVLGAYCMGILHERFIFK